MGTTDAALGALRLDHLVVVAPTLSEGVAHVEECISVTVPFGQSHRYMGTHNHLLQLGDSVYLEIVALDPDASPPGRARWFGLDDQTGLRAAWDDGRRLRTWVARVDAIDQVLARHAGTFGAKVSLPWVAPSFDIGLLDDGSMPLDGAAPTLIDRRGKARAMASMGDVGARLRSFSLQSPGADAVTALYRALRIDRPPSVDRGEDVRYRASIQTPWGQKELF